MEESVILNIQYTGYSTVAKLKAPILVEYFPFFWPKKLHNDFFWQYFLVILKVE